MKSNPNIIKKSCLNELLKNIIKSVIKERIGIDWGGYGPPKRLHNPKLGVYPANFREVPNYIRIRKSNAEGEFMVAWFTNGKFNDDKSYYTDDLKDAYDTFKAMQKNVDADNGMAEEQSVTGAVAPVTGPMAFKRKPMEGLEPLGGMEEEEKIDEMTTTGAVAGYNVPGAFSRKGGSEKGVAGSAALGYKLTNVGKKDMNLRADKLYEGKKK